MNTDQQELERYRTDIRKRWKTNLTEAQVIKGLAAVRTKYANRPSLVDRWRVLGHRRAYGATYGDLSKEFGISRARVHQLYIGFLWRIRKEAFNETP